MIVTPLAQHYFILREPFGCAQGRLFASLRMKYGC